MQLEFHGPFGLTAESIAPMLFNSALADACGIYVWTVLLPTAYRIAYVGKTDGRTGSFRNRLWTEVQRSLNGLDGYLDIPLIEREYVGQFQRP